MKVIGNLPIVKDIDAKYPFGATIQNETDTNDGTPVIREIYGDILMNLYKIMQLAGITPNDLEDNSDTQFQLVDAFKKFSNEINDVNHVLELNGNVWSLPLNLAILPNKFVCFAQVTDNYVSTESYTFKGTGTLEVPFNSTGFNASEQVLIVIESTGVKAFSLEKLQEVADAVYTPLGSPIAFNDTDKMYYKEEGYLISDLPSSSDLQQLIRVFASDGTLVLNDVFVQNGKVICVVFIPAESEYGIYDLSLDLTSISLNITFGSGTDYFPYFYLDLEGNLFVTNSGNDEIDDFLINKYSRDVIGNFVSISTTTIEADFEKTTNAVIHNGFIYTFVNGYLRKYNLTTGIKTDVMYLPSVNGQLFRFNGEVYFTTGEIAKKWFLS